MPDKQNENKFMAMLERRGIVRKADSEEDASVAEPSGVQRPPEADLRSLFGSPPGESSNVIPAARQPVPGFSNPIMPSELQQQPEHEQPKPAEESLGRENSEHEERVELEQTRSAIQYISKKQPEPEMERITSDQPEPVIERIPYESPKPVDNPGSTTFISGINPFKGDLYKPEDTPVIPVEPAAYAQPAMQPPVEDYTERYLSIDDLFEVLSLRSKRTDTIYLIEEYLKTLPDSLPDDSRREIVRKLITASGFDYDILMGDGVLRVKMLKEYAEKFAKYTDDYVTARNEELAELEQQSLRIHKLIENRKELHKKQFFAIETEAQRLKEILTFISG